LNNNSRIRLRAPFPGLRILLDNPTPVICAVRPSGISDPLVLTVFDQKTPLWHFTALWGSSSVQDCSLFHQALFLRSADANSIVQDDIEQ
jgi:hypothetical protein